MNVNSLSIFILRKCLHKNLKQMIIKLKMMMTMRLVLCHLASLLNGIICFTQTEDAIWAEDVDDDVGDVLSGIVPLSYWGEHRISLSHLSNIQSNSSSLIDMEIQVEFKSSYETVAKSGPYH